jgi:hypothetical protein
VREQPDQSITGRKCQNMVHLLLTLCLYGKSQYVYVYVRVSFHTCPTSRIPSHHPSTCSFPFQASPRRKKGRNVFTTCALLGTPPFLLATFPAYVCFLELGGGFFGILPLRGGCRRCRLFQFFHGSRCGGIGLLAMRMCPGSGNAIRFLILGL